MMYFLLLLHNFKSSVTLECWIKRNSLQDEWIMPAMTSSTGITLRACSALSRKQLTFYWIPFFFFFLYIFPFYFFLHTNTHTQTHTLLLLSFSFNEFVEEEEMLQERPTKRMKKPVLLSFFPPFFVLLFQTVARSTYPTVTVYTVRIRMWREKNRNLQDGDSLQKVHTHNTARWPPSCTYLYTLYTVYTALS